MTELREKVARAIAEALGDDLDDAFVNKSEWNAARGEKGGRYRDINEPMREDYLAAAHAVLNLIGGDGWRPNWRHVKRGSDYQVVGMGAVQSDIPLNDMDVVVIYRDQAGMFWARRREEFFDGRFEEIAASPPPPASS